VPAVLRRNSRAAFAVATPFAFVCAVAPPRRGNVFAVNQHPRSSWAVRPAFCATVVTVALAAAAAAGTWSFKPTPAEQRAIASISADSLKAHLAFLSSNPLQGRGAGTLGLDVAAEYIASHFRRAGLKPVGDDGYFQTTPRVRLSPNPDGYRCAIESGDMTIEVAPSQFALSAGLAASGNAIRETHVENLSIVKVPIAGPVPEGIGDAAGRVIVTDLPPVPTGREQEMAYVIAVDANMRRVWGALKPAGYLFVRRDTNATGYFSATSLVDPAERGRQVATAPSVVVAGTVVARWFDTLPTGETGATLSVDLGAPLETPAPQRNVIGVLPGSDPKLAETYVLVTAHYDGQGRPPTPGWNSANDNGSGTVSIIEMANALASLKPRPKRSIAFITFHGEESGLVGSRYYAEHPVLPLEETVADINIEMVGRTDDVEGDQHKRASVTGFDYSDVGEILRVAGAANGITVFKHDKNSDAYFGRSDNQALATLGVPAHTICGTFRYPDYHGVADTWDKIEYDNMAMTVRTIASGLLMIANSPVEPQWNPAVARASRYLEAWKKLHGRQ